MRELDEIESDPAWERIVEAVRRDPAPAPPVDLAERSLARVRSVTLYWELLRLATLEAFWSRFRTRGTDAISSKGRDSGGRSHPDASSVGATGRPLRDD